MRWVAVAGAGLISFAGFAGAASAADLPAVAYTKAPVIVDPVYNWTGFYLGIAGGFDWARSQYYRNDPVAGVFNGLRETAGIKANGALAGGTFGYNYQFSNHVVIGFENDISWTNNKGAANLVTPFTPSTATDGISQNWLYTARGRLGFAWDRWMVFGTGGVAFTNEGMQLCDPAMGCGSQSQIVTGWTAGGGVEYALAGNWSAKLEYLHNDFGSQYLGRTVVPGFAFFARDATLTNDIVRAGLNYKLGWGGSGMAAYASASAVVDPNYHWTGFYLGVEGGADWGRSRHYYDDTASPALIGLAQTSGIKANGELAGGTFGYNYQLANNLVVGFEDDLSWTSNKGTAGYIAPFGPLTNTAETSQDWLYTARGRLGYAWNRWILFGTGGVAFTDERVQLCSLAFGCGSQSHVVAGWTAGGGVEYALANNWSAKLEYLHNDFGSQYFSQTPDAGGGFFHARSVTLTDDIVRAGVNYKFGWGGSTVVGQ
jgi:outer membrane immunogenic protein